MSCKITSPLAIKWEHKSCRYLILQSNEMVENGKLWSLLSKEEMKRWWLYLSLYHLTLIVVRDFTFLTLHTQYRERSELFSKMNLSVTWSAVTSKICWKSQPVSGSGSMRVSLSTEDDPSDVQVIIRGDHQSMARATGAPGPGASKTIHQGSHISVINNNK